MVNNSKNMLTIVGGSIVGITIILKHEYQRKIWTKSQNAKRRKDHVYRAFSEHFQRRQKLYI